MTRKVPRVVYLQRRPRQFGNFSVEHIFEDVRSRLADRIEPVVRVAPFYSNGIIRRAAILLAARAAKGDVYHVTGDINFAALSINPDRCVLTVLDCGFLHSHSGWKRSILKRFWLTWPVKHARIVTTISEAIRNEIIHETGCLPDKVVVVPVAISDGFSWAPRSFNSAKPRILQVGTAENKNLPRLIQAIEGVSCTLTIVGRVSEQLRLLLARCRVEYESFSSLSSEEVIAQYHRCDMVSFVSTYEGFGMPILEANAVGRPVITSLAASMPEVAGNAALLVNPLSVDEIRQGVLRLIEDANYREQLIQNGRENCKRFRGEEIALKYLNIYNKIHLD